MAQRPYNLWLQGFQLWIRQWLLWWWGIWSSVIAVFVRWRRIKFNHACLTGWWMLPKPDICCSHIGCRWGCHCVLLTAFTRITTTIYRQQFTVIDDNKLEEVVLDEYTHIQDASQLHDISIPAVQLADNPSQPLGHNAMQHGDLDFEKLITMKHQHQTKQAATGVHTRKFKADSSQLETTILRHFEFISLSILSTYHQSLSIYSILDNTSS